MNDKETKQGNGLNLIAIRLLRQSDRAQRGRDAIQKRTS
jgi:hypothetical protein